jgi:hypothetical protein
MAASYFLLLAQKKVTKEKGTLGFAPLAERAVRYGWTGFAHRPSMACCRNRRDPSRRPRAGHAAFRPPSAATQREPERARAKEKEKNRRVAYIRCRIYPVLLRQGLPRSALPGFPLGRGKDSEEKPRSGGRQDAGHFDESTRMCSRRSPPSPCVVCRAWMPGKPRPRGCLFLWLLSFGQAKESNWRPWMADKSHTDVSRLSRQNPTQSQSGFRPTRRITSRNVRLIRAPARAVFGKSW